MLSGTADCVWAEGSEENQILQAHSIAADLGKPQSSAEDLVDFFKNVDPDDIIYYAVFFNNHRKYSIDFSPIIESSFIAMCF